MSAPSPFHRGATHRSHLHHQHLYPYSPVLPFSSLPGHRAACGAGPVSSAAFHSRLLLGMSHTSFPAPSCVVNRPASSCRCRLKVSSSCRLIRHIGSGASRDAITRSSYSTRHLPSSRRWSCLPRPVALKTESWTASYRPLSRGQHSSTSCRHASKPLHSRATHLIPRNSASSRWSVQPRD